MRLRICLDDELVAEVDRRVGREHRTAFIERAVAGALDDERWSDIVASLGSIEDHGHAWDTDPAAWVRHGRSDRTG